MKKMYMIMFMFICAGIGSISVSMYGMQAAVRKMRTNATSGRGVTSSMTMPRVSTPPVDDRRNGANKKPNFLEEPFIVLPERVIIEENAGGNQPPQTEKKPKWTWTKVAAALSLWLWGQSEEDEKNELIKEVDNFFATSYVGVFPHTDEVALLNKLVIFFNKAKDQAAVDSLIDHIFKMYEYGYSETKTEGEFQRNDRYLVFLTHLLGGKPAWASAQEGKRPDIEKLNADSRFYTNIATIVKNNITTMVKNQKNVKAEDQHEITWPAELIMYYLIPQTVQRPDVNWSFLKDLDKDIYQTLMLGYNKANRDLLFYVIEKWPESKSRMAEMVADLDNYLYNITFAPKGRRQQWLDSWGLWQFLMRVVASNDTDLLDDIKKRCNIHGIKSPVMEGLDAIQQEQKEQGARLKKLGKGTTNE